MLQADVPREAWQRVLEGIDAVPLIQQVTGVHGKLEASDQLSGESGIEEEAPLFSAAFEAVEGEG